MQSINHNTKNSIHAIRNDLIKYPSRLLFTDIKMKPLFYFPYSTPNPSLLFHHANIRHGTLHHQTEQIQYQTRALAQCSVGGETMLLELRILRRPCPTKTFDHLF